MIFLSFVISLILTFGSLAQPPDSLWSRMYGGEAGDICYSVQQTTDGGYMLAGITESFGAGVVDFWLVKTDDNGDSLWSRTYGGRYYNHCYSAQQTSDGGYILAGHTYSSDVWWKDLWLVKTDINGDTLWTRTYRGLEEDYCHAVKQTTDGGYVLAGTTQSYGVGNSDFWLVKTDDNGDSLWSRTFGGVSFDQCRSVQQTADGGYMLAGHTYSFGAGWYDFWLVKTDANGDSLWSRTFGGSGSDWCYSAQQTADDGFVLVGTTTDYDSGRKNLLLVKTDENGDSLWGRTMQGTDSDIYRFVTQTGDSGYVLGGSIRPSGSGFVDFFLMKVDTNGDSLWSRTFGGSSSDHCMSVQQTADGGFVLAGMGTPPEGGWCDFWLIKTGPEGTPVWERRIPAPQKFNLSVYPNPFNPTATISFNLPKAMQAQLRIFDITGRVVTTLADEHFSAGSHQLHFDASAYPSGAYFANLRAGDYQKTTKLVLLK